MDRYIYRKSQSATEFLMTYGWAILLVLIVITILVNFGFFDPRLFIPDNAQIEPGLDIKTAAVDEDSILFILQNNMGRTLRDLIINVTECEDGEGALSDNITIPAGVSKKITVYCGNTSSPNTKFQSKLSVTYSTKTPPSSVCLTHYKTGSIMSTVNRGNQSFASQYDSTEIDGESGCQELDQEYTQYKLGSDFGHVVGTCLVVKANNVIIDFDGYSINGDNSSIDYGIFIDGYNGTIIKNGILTGFKGDKGPPGDETYGGAAIYLKNSYDSRISNMTIHSNYHGILLESCYNNQILDSNFSLNNYTIPLGSMEGCGIHSINSVDNVIKGNKFSFNAYGIHIISTNSTSLISNEANNNYYAGIRIENSSSNLLEANEASNNDLALFSHAGVEIENSDRIVIEDLTANSNTYGIKLISSTNTNITYTEACNNTITDFRCSDSVCTFGLENLFGKGKVMQCFDLWPDFIYTDSGDYDYCDSDNDGDGVTNSEEDLNNNQIYSDDDTDGDATPDYLDNDDDNDAVLSRFEDPDGDGNPVNDDTDNNGVADYLDPDDDGDGIFTLDEVIECNNDPDNCDTDNDGFDNYIDSDDDNDGVPTKYELGDKDSNSIPDYLDDNYHGDDSAILILDCNALQEVRDYMSGNYEIDNNIECSTFSDFEPIGTSSNPFIGTLDGKGFTISGLIINKPSDNYVGFIGYARGAEIRNISLENADIVGNDSIGALVGFARDATLISDSYSTGNVTGHNYVGGLVGSVYNGTTISSSYSDADVACSYRSAGLVGYSISSSILNSYSSGNVVCSSFHNGGLIGYADNSDIFNSYSSSNITGTTIRLGGLIGYANEDRINNSYSTGKIMCSSDCIAQFGGFIGYSRLTNVSNSYCYNFPGDSAGGCVGGTTGGSVSVSTIINEQDLFDITHDVYDSMPPYWDFTNIWTENPGAYPTLKIFE